jgi:hypothetical protein
VGVDPDESSTIVPRVMTDVTAAMDIFFVMGIPFILSVTTGISLLMVNYLSARTTSQLMSAIKLMVSTHASRGYRMTHIFCDGEGAMGPAVRKLGESQPDIMPPCSTLQRMVNMFLQWSAKRSRLKRG